MLNFPFFMLWAVWYRRCANPCRLYFRLPSLPPHMTTLTQAQGFGEVLVPYSPWFRCYSPTLDELMADNRTEVMGGYRGGGGEGRCRECVQRGTGGGPPAAGGRVGGPSALFSSISYLSGMISPPSIIQAMATAEGTPARGLGEAVQCPPSPCFP